VVPAVLVAVTLTNNTFLITTFIQSPQVQLVPEPPVKEIMESILPLARVVLAAVAVQQSRAEQTILPLAVTDLRRQYRGLPLLAAVVAADLTVQEVRAVTAVAAALVAVRVLPIQAVAVAR
jgi:hypothetical protein